MSIDQYVITRNMALLRIISSFLELTAAILIMKIGRVETALRINALLGLTGPIFLIGVTLIGVTALTDNIDPLKLALILIGVGLVFIGTR